MLPTVSFARIACGAQFSLALDNSGAVPCHLQVLPGSRRWKVSHLEVPKVSSKSWTESCDGSRMREKVTGNHGDGNYMRTPERGNSTCGLLEWPLQSLERTMQTKTMLFPICTKILFTTLQAPPHHIVALLQQLQGLVLGPQRWRGLGSRSFTSTRAPCARAHEAGSSRRSDDWSVTGKAGRSAGSGQFGMCCFMFYLR